MSASARTDLQGMSACGEGVAEDEPNAQHPVQRLPPAAGLLALLLLGGGLC